jgi:hypothetical protein
VEQLSHSHLKSRSFSLQRVIPMSRNAAPLADRPGKNDRAVAVPREVTQATSHNVKCSPRRVHDVAKLLKFRSNPEKADRYIAAIAIVLLK